MCTLRFVRNEGVAMGALAALGKPIMAQMKIRLRREWSIERSSSKTNLTLLIRVTGEYGARNFNRRICLQLPRNEVQGSGVWYPNGSLQLYSILIVTIRRTLIPVTIYTITSTFAASRRWQRRHRRPSTLSIGIRAEKRYQ